MNLKLKSVYFSERMSEETNAFTADLWLGNKKVAYIKNDGHGGSTYYNAYDKMRPLLTKAEIYAQSLPRVKYRNAEWDMNLEHLIDDMFTEWLKNKELSKHSKKGILYKTKEGKEMLYSWKGMTITKMLNDPIGQSRIRVAILGLKGEGATILNNNFGTMFD